MASEVSRGYMRGLTDISNANGEVYPTQLFSIAQDQDQNVDLTR